MTTNRRLAAYVVVAVMSSLLATPAAGSGAAPAVAIVSPESGTVVGAASIDVVVAFRAVGNVRRITLEANGREVGHRVIPASRKEGTEVFDLDLAGLTGAVTLRAYAWQASEQAGIRSASAPVTISRPTLPDLAAVTVTSSPDAARRTTGTIGALGGTLVTEDAAGNRYELAIPPGALTSDTEISMTPTTVTGLDAIATSTRYAVDFAPAGLVFDVPLVLRITPPVGAPPFGDSLFASWQDEPGIELGVPGVAMDGTIRIPVQHFSGMTTLQAQSQSYDNMLTLALVASVGISAADVDAIRAAVDGLPGTADQVIGLVMQLHDGIVAPAIAHTGDGIVPLRFAANRVAQFAILYQVFDIGDLVVAPGPPVRDLDDVLVAALGGFVSAAKTFLASHVAPACSATVTSLADWFAVPVAANAELASFAEGQALTFCAAAALDSVVFPATIDPSEQLVTGSFRGIVRAPSQTPGGSLSGTHKVYPQPTSYDLQSSGGRFLADDQSVSGTSGADGLVSFIVDRGPTPRPARVAVTGEATVGGFWSDVEESVSLGATFPVALSVGPPAETRVMFRDPPVDRYLSWFDDTTTELCVDLADAEGNVLDGATVHWDVSGPGSVAAPSSVSDAVGVSCVDYHHHDGPVLQGVTTLVTASTAANGVSGNDSVTLHPSWVRIELEVQPASASSGIPATNTTVSMGPTETAQVRVTATASGTTLADPPVPLNDVVGVEVTGGGALYDQFGEAVDGSFAPDVSGLATLSFDPAGSTGDTQLRFFNPFAGVGVAASVTLDRTPPGVVTLSPQRPSLAFGQSLQFGASVQNVTDPSVTWIATGGAIDQTGNYTAGATAGVFTVTARSVADPSAIATTQVRVAATIPITGAYTGTCTRLDMDPQPSGAMPPGYAHHLDATLVPGRIALIMPQLGDFCGALVSWPNCLWLLPPGFTGGAFDVSAPSSALGGTCGGFYATQTAIDGSLSHGILRITMYVLDLDGNRVPYKSWNLSQSF